jgi:phage virion morphogenesis protein
VTIALEVKVDEGEVGKALEALARRAVDLDPVLDEIGASQVTEVQQRFEGEHGPDGAKWAPLAASTVAKRGRRSGSARRDKRGRFQRRGAGGAKILRDQGNLYDSVSHAVFSGGVKIGANTPYARIQQLGGRAGRGHAALIPARPYLGVSDEGAREMIAIVHDHLARAL